MGKIAVTVELEMDDRMDNNQAQELAKGIVIECLRECGFEAEVTNCV